LNPEGRPSGARPDKGDETITAADGPVVEHDEGDR
jgi:hypothetical protein